MFATQTSNALFSTSGLSAQPVVAPMYASECRRYTLNNACNSRKNSPLRIVTVSLRGRRVAKGRGGAGGARAAGRSSSAISGEWVKSGDVTNVARHFVPIKSNYDTLGSNVVGSPECPGGTSVMSACRNSVGESYQERQLCRVFDTVIN